MYVCSAAALNEGPVKAITGRYSVIEYVYDGIFIDENVKIEKEVEAAPE